MNSLHIRWLQLNCLQVILFSFLQLVGLVPTESSIIEGFEVVGVKVNCLGIVLNSCVEVALLSIGKSSVMIKVSLARLNLDRCCKALNCFIKVTSSIERDTFVVISVRILRVNLNCSCVILYCKTELAQFVVSKSSIEKCLEMIWIDFESFCIQSNRGLVVTLLPSSIALCVECFSLRFKFWVELNVLHIYRLWERLGCFSSTILLIR